MDLQEEHGALLHCLLGKLKVRNAEQTWAFKDVFTSHQVLLTLNEMMRQQTLDQDKVDACVDTSVHSSIAVSSACGRKCWMFDCEFERGAFSETDQVDVGSFS